MFLTLTPSMHRMDSSSRLPEPLDQATSNLVAESLAYHLVSGDTQQPLANSPGPASVENKASINQGDGTFAEYNKAIPSVSVSEISEPASVKDKASISQGDGTFAEQNKAISSVSVSEVSVENHVDDAILPAVDSTNQDTVATIHLTEFLSPATVLKRRLERTKDLIVCPGVYDGFSARIALSVGFDALYMVISNNSRLHVQACSHRPDRCRHHSLSPRPARPWPRTAQRHACSCRHDRQP